MADERNAPARNRRFDSKSMGRKWMLFAGDCAQVGEALASKPIKPGWVALGFVDSVFRTYGQVLFCNNPVTGLLVLSALLVAEPFHALASLACCCIAIVTAWLIDQPPELVRAGIFSFNSLLVGSVSMSLLPYVKGIDEVSGLDWLFMIIAAIMGVYLTSAYFTLFGHISKHPMPGFTVPFVTVQTLVFICASSPVLLQGALPQQPQQEALAGPRVARAAAPLGTLGLDFEGKPLSARGSTLDAAEAVSEEMGLEGMLADAPAIVFEGQVNATEGALDWGNVFTGALLSMSQVFAQNHLPAALLMYLAVVLSSPTTALMCLLGSTINTLVGAMFAPDLQAVYEGHWGFNGLLTAASMGGFTLVVTPQSVGLTVMATLFCSLIQVAITPTFARMRIPIMSVPFNTAALIMLCATAVGHGSLVRPPAITYPEKHWRDWRREQRARKLEKLRSISETLPENGTDADQTRKLEMV